MVWEIRQSSRAVAGLCVQPRNLQHARLGLLVAPGLKLRSGTQGHAPAPKMQAEVGAAQRREWLWPWGVAGRTEGQEEAWQVLMEGDVA